MLGACEAIAPGDGAAAEPDASGPMMPVPPSLPGVDSGAPSGGSGGTMARPVVPFGARTEMEAAGCGCRIEARRSRPVKTVLWVALSGGAIAVLRKRRLRTPERDASRSR
jgi:hypothetical protein